VTAITDRTAGPIVVTFAFLAGVILMVLHLQTVTIQVSVHVKQAQELEDSFVINV
jgi:hypothetical protein